LHVTKGLLSSFQLGFLISNILWSFNALSS
jgi:hypothetical protein